MTEVDEQRSPQTKTSFGALLDAWLRIHDAEPNTIAGYETHARLYLRPALGDVPVAKVSARMLEDLYAQLRRCRQRCGGRPFVEHRVDGPHECRDVRHRRRPGRPAREEQHDCVQLDCAVEECQQLMSAARPMETASSTSVLRPWPWE